MKKFIVSAVMMSGFVVFGQEVPEYVEKKEFEKLQNYVANISEGLGNFVEDEFDYIDQERDKIKKELKSIDGYLDDYFDYISKNEKLIENNSKGIKENKKSIEGLKEQVEKSFNEILDWEDHVNNTIIEDLLTLEEKVETNAKDVDLAVNKNRADIQNIKTELNTIAAEKNISEIRDSIKSVENVTKVHETKLTNLESGVAMVAAMDAADFSNLSKGDLEVSAGVATYAKKKAVAVGFAYAPTNNFSMNAKLGVNFGAENKFAASAGARYKFNLNK